MDRGWLQDAQAGFAFMRGLGVSVLAMMIISLYESGYPSNMRA